MGCLRGCFMLLWVAIFAHISISGATNRKLLMTTHRCPADICHQNQSIISVQAKADDNNSTLYYLWTTFHVPTIVVAYTTSDNTQLYVNWRNLTLSNHTDGIRFLPPVNYAMGFAIPRIYEYDDNDDNVDLNDNIKMLIHDLSSGVTWQTKHDNSTGKVTFTGNRSIIFECTASDSDGRESYLPHLKYTSDSNRFTISLDNMTLMTNKTRFAFELNYVVQDGQKPDVAMEKSFDDEYSPAVFETVYGKIVGKKGRAYSQWKPVAYTKPELGRKSQTRASAGDVQEVSSGSPNIGEIVMSGKYSSYGLNVSFGLTKDGFYQKNKYLTWSGIVGYGDPAKDSLSFLVILIIFIGLGLPLAIIMFGGTYVQVRKRCFKNVNTSYGRIN